MCSKHVTVPNFICLLVIQIMTLFAIRYVVIIYIIAKGYCEVEKYLIHPMLHSGCGVRMILINTSASKHGEWSLYEKILF